MDTWDEIGPRDLAEDGIDAIPYRIWDNLTPEQRRLLHLYDEYWCDYSETSPKLVKAGIEPLKDNWSSVPEHWPGFRKPQAKQGISGLHWEDIKRRRK